LNRSETFNQPDGKSLLTDFPERSAAMNHKAMSNRAMYSFAVVLILLASALRASGQDRDWRNYGNDLANTRFQPIDQINPSNVGKLKVAWVFHTGVLDPLAALEASPIAVGGRLFITDGHDNVFALNAATGKMLWKFPGFSTEQTAQFFLCCGQLNKGVAFGDGMVFVGRFDDSIVALNAATGKLVWTTTVANWHDRVSINSAPQFVRDEAGNRDLVIISLSGGEFEIRGHVFALNAKTGQVAWDFSTTLPASFAGQSFLTGGAAVWNPPAIDPELGLVYLSVGNAAPDILGENRSGANLFATSITAVDVHKGQPVWSFQTVHHDIWDYDSAQPPVLFTLEKDGKQFQALGHCAKTGQYFILDRRTGKPIFAVTERPVPKGPTFQNAAPTQPFSAVEPLTPLSFDQLTAVEQPEVATITAAFSSFLAPGQSQVALSPQYTPPDETLRLIMPGDNGGCEWNPAAFSPRTKFVYYGARHDPDLFKTHPANTDLIPQPANGALHLGSNFINHVPGARPFGIYGATDTRTGKVVWKIRTASPAKGGMLAAGDLVFWGEGSGKFRAADARTGAILFTYDGPHDPTQQNIGGAQANPVAYMVDGREFIVNAFGGNVPDRSITANGNCLGIEPGQTTRDLSTCANPVGDAFIAFALASEEDDEDED
jgi:quinohemoprotein ethanol dehydrogenase